jgi:hypothetical protein
LATLSLVFVAACASGPDSAPQRVDEFIGHVESVQTAAELSRVKVGEATAQLRALATADPGGDGVIAAYGRFARAVDESERQAKAFTDALTPMRSSAEVVFSGWESEVGRIANDRLRERSMARLKMSRDRYQAVIDVADPAQVEFDRINAMMRDIALFLGHDLNVGALTAIQDDVREVTGSADRLEAALTASLHAARAYVDTAAVPAAPAAEPAPSPRTPAASRVR